MINPKIYNKIVNTPVHKAARKIHSAMFPFPKNWMDATGQTANRLIKKMLLSEEPCLIARFGSIEIEAIMAYLHQDARMMPWERFYRFASWDVRYKGWKEPLKKKLANNAGFFPTDNDHLNRFAKLYLDLVPDIDIVGSWIHAETLLKDRMPNVQRIPLTDLEPYLNDTPWSKALEGRKVLVIHPFAESIQNQHAKHTLLFNDPNVLPSFELITLRAVQSAGENQVPFANWFTALESMKTEIDKMDFNTAIIGSGAYGLPLAAHIKAIGKQAVHLGGATQMLFGVYGQRWLKDPLRTPLINEHWIRPQPSEKMDNASSIENGCYW